MDLSDIEELLEFARVDKETAQQIWRDVKANQKKLDGCKGPHDFQPLPIEGQALIRDYRCLKCGGKLDAIHKSWYDEGLKHGRSEAQSDSGKTA
jgi:hypothetical protein